jgi:hypothetical protein
MKKSDSNECNIQNDDAIESNAQNECSSLSSIVKQSMLLGVKAATSYAGGGRLHQASCAQSDVWPVPILVRLPLFE